MGSSSLELDLFAPRGRITADRLAHIVGALLAAGWVYDPDAWNGTWRRAPAAEDGGLVASRTAPDAMPLPREVAAYQRGSDWCLWLHAPVPDEVGAPAEPPPEARWLLADGRWLPGWLPVRLRVDSTHAAVDVVQVSCGRPHEPLPLLRQLFLGWAGLVVPPVRPLWGCAGADYGDVRWEFVQARKAEIAALRVCPVEWLTVVGQPSVARTGAPRLLAAPAWRTALLGDGSVSLALAPDEEEASDDATGRLADYLGVPHERW